MSSIDFRRTSIGLASKCLVTASIVFGWVAFSIWNHRLDDTSDRSTDRWLPVSAPVTHTNADDGKALYARQCASCHGDQGQGVRGHYKHPLRGTLSVEKLTELISETMPEDDPDACRGEDAEKVARYIHASFYRKPDSQPRIQLARLTENQFRNSVADLIGSFRRPTTIDQVNEKDGLGLRASYYHSRHFQAKKLVKKRIDATVDFDFGDQLPDVIPPPEKPIKKKNNLDFDPNEFSISWQGAIRIEHSGEYEFIVRSKNGFRLYVNSYGAPVINQWVQSGDEEYRISLNLLGGRLYPIKLDFFRFKDKTSSIQLLWKPPHQSESLVPESVLIPKHVSGVGILKTEFPPDDSSHGYPRGIDVSQRWDEAVTFAAIEVANEMIPITGLHNTRQPFNASREKKLRQQCYDFVERALGTSLTEQERAFYVDQFFVDELKPIDRLKRVVILTIKSPRFLYPGLGLAKQPESIRERIGKRLALYMWDSIPDQELKRVIDRKLFDDQKLFHQQVSRMLEDVRGREKLKGFFEYWLMSAESGDVSKDKKRFPDFNEHVVADSRRSLSLFVDDIFWSESSDYRQLYLADYLLLNPRLSHFYGLGDAEGDPPKDDQPDYVEDGAFAKVKVDPQKRAGILTHPYLMTNLAYFRNTSPIHRGVFIARSLLGRTLPPPPNDVDPLSESFNPEMTTRQRVEFQTKEVACMSCHSVINPLGFSLENFDAVGRFRKKEKDKPINVKANLELDQGKTTEFNGPRELAEFLAKNKDSQKSFIRHLFQHLIKQPVEAYGKNQLNDLHSYFVEHEYNMKMLVIEIVRVATLHKIQNRKPAKS